MRSESIVLNALLLFLMFVFKVKRYCEMFKKKIKLIREHKVISVIEGDTEVFVHVDLKEVLDSRSL